MISKNHIDKKNDAQEDKLNYLYLFPTEKLITTNKRLIKDSNNNIKYTPLPKND